MEVSEVSLPRRTNRSLRFLSFLRRNMLLSIGLIISIFLFILSIGADWIAPNDPLEQNLQSRETPPFVDPRFPLGTDQLGRCTLSRVIHGGQVSLSVGLFTSTISAVIGITLGLIGGFSGRFIREMVERIIDITLATPEILVALALAAILGRSLMIVMVSVSLVWWANYARIVRGQVLQLREMDFVVAAESIGASRGRIILHHIFPNTITQVLVMVSLNMSAAILIEAGLSFLGLGTQPPTPSWGSMLSVGRNYLRTMPWLSTIPGIAIVITVLGFNLLGDGLRDLLDPRLRQ
jgi:peptide/nickel transport system permease protein